MTIIGTQYGNFHVGARLHNVNGIIEHPLQRMGWIDPVQGVKQQVRTPPSGMTQAAPTPQNLNAGVYTPWNDNSHVPYFEIHKNPGFY